MLFFCGLNVMGNGSKTAGLDPSIFQILAECLPNVKGGKLHCCQKTENGVMGNCAMECIQKESGTESAAFRSGRPLRSSGQFSQVCFAKSV